MSLKLDTISQEKITLVGERYRNMPWEVAEVYADYLAQTYYYVTYSTRLLALAAGNMSPADHIFFKRFTKHIGEESDHERVALADLKKLGASLEDYSELSETKMMYECQFYKIEHQDPLALLGYILFLEVVATQDCPYLCELITNLYGAPCANFVRIHGQEDPEHVEQAFEVLDSLAPERRQLVLSNLHQTADTVMNMLDSIERRQLMMRKMSFLCG